MYHVTEDVNIILSQILKELCDENCNKLNHTSNDNFNNEVMEFSDLCNNGGDTDQEKMLFSHENQKTPPNSITEFEQNEEGVRNQNLFESLSNTFQNENIVENSNKFFQHTSNQNFQTKSELYRKDENESLDDAIENAFIKYETFYHKDATKLKNVSVQTTNPMELTADKQCQCDLNIDQNLNADSASKQIKLNNFAYCLNMVETNWKSDDSEQSEIHKSKDNKANYTKIDKEALKIKSTRIRVGLSKRVRPPPLHIMN